jgi:hypothetical protein
VDPVPCLLASAWATVSIPAALLLAAGILYGAKAVSEVATGIWYQTRYLPRIAGED